MTEPASKAALSTPSTESEPSSVPQETVKTSFASIVIYTPHSRSFSPLSFLPQAQRDTTQHSASARAMNLRILSTPFYTFGRRGNAPIQR